MARMMQVALPIIALGAAAFTGGTSLGLFGASAVGGAEAGAAAAAGDAIASAGTAGTAAAGGSWFGSTIAAITPYLRPAAAVAQIGGTAIQAIGAHNAGEAANAEAESEAAQQNANASNAQSAAERRMVEQNRETSYVLSNAQAAAAAGGGSATDPTVVSNMKTIAGEGRYRALTDMYQGNASAQASRNQGAATSYGGKLAAGAGNEKMYSTILTGGASLFDKYGNVDEDEK